MRYMGGKCRIAKDLSNFLNQQLQPGQVFVDAFCGSCNIVSQIDQNRIRIANDVHRELIAMWREVQKGRELPDEISKEQYYWVKEHGEDWFKGFIGFACSFGGKWWGGYAKNDRRNFCKESKNSTLKKAGTMKDVIFLNMDYKSLSQYIPPNSLIYCDIPYKNTTGYMQGYFNHEEFYSWCKILIQQGHNVLVSEYGQNIPIGAYPVWCKKSKQDMKNKQNIRQQTIEVVYTW